METSLRDLVRDTSFGRAGDLAVQYGQQILIAAAIFLLGLIAVKFLLVWLKKTLLKYTENQHLASKGLSPAINDPATAVLAIDSFTGRRENRGF
jgi:hypothetical protein